MSNDILIHGGTVWNGVDFSRCDILVKNGVITKIENSIKEKAEIEIDARNMIVSSGLIDLHTHIKDISPDSIGIEAKKISYPFGVTYLVDASASQGSESVISYTDRAISVLAEVKIINNKADFSYAEEVMSAYKDKVVGLKVYVDTSFVDVWNTEPLKDICKYAKDRNLFVMVHTTNSPVSMLEIVDTLNKGDIISHAFHGGENNCSDDAFECLKKANEKGIYIDAALCAYYHIDYSIFRQAVRNSVCPDIISSDITKELEFISDVRYGLPICMSILQKLGLDTRSLFKAVTVNPSAILQKTPNNGCLNVGDLADIAIFKHEECNITLTDTANNIIELDKYLKCVLTMHNGRIVYIED